MDKKTIKMYEKKLKEKKREILSTIQSSKSSGDESIAEMVQDIADKAASSYSRELLYGLSDAERKIFLLIEEALQRIKEGRYGICVYCNQKIQKKRLDAVPWARHCIECQEMQEKGLIK